MVNIYAANTSNLPDPKEFPEVMEGLSEGRIEKILRFRKEEDRKQSLGAGLLLKYCLEKAGLSMKDIRHGENGKPQIDNFYFNLSHSKDMVVCAVSERAVGCDIECIGEMREGIAERYFTPNEIIHLNQYKNEEKRDEFYRLWTMKESYMKMTGEGMSLALNRFEFVFSDEVKVYRDGSHCSCYITEYEIPGYKLTVCSEERAFDEEIKYIDLR